MKRTRILTTIAFFLLLFCLAIIFSCNDEQFQAKAQTDSVQKKMDSAITFKSVDGLLDILYMERDEFLALPTNPNPPPQPPNLKKLVFQFCVPDTGRNSLNLAVYPSKNQRYDQPNPSAVLHNSWIDSETDITDRTVFLGHQKLGKPKIRRIRKALIDTPELMFLVFYPRLAGQRIHYDIYLERTIHSDTLRNFIKTRLNRAFTSLNPSPPASDLEDDDN